MAVLLNKIDHERATTNALKLLKKKNPTDIDEQIPLSTNPPYWLRYSTQVAFDGLPTTSYARMVLIDPTAHYPQIPGFQDGIQYPLEADEVGVRDFTMDHNKRDEISKVFSGLHVRPEYMRQGIGSFLIGLTNTIIEDMITRFLKDQPDTLVFAFMVDGAHSNGTGRDRHGWTSYHAQQLGFRSTRGKKYLPSFMKRFPVKRILANSANS